MLLTGKLAQHCPTIDKIAFERADEIVYIVYHELQIRRMEISSNIWYCNFIIICDLKAVVK